MDMRDHRVESTRRDVFKPQVLLDFFMKQFHIPAILEVSGERGPRGSARPDPDAPLATRGPPR